MAYNHRSLMPNQQQAPIQGQMSNGGFSERLHQMLDAIKNEFESVTQDTSIYRMQRDEFEMKIAGQIQELQQIQQSIFDLERAHTKMKQQYEEEIMRLRRELESRGIPLPPSNLNNVSSMNTPMNPSHQPPMLGHGSGLFNTSGGHAMLPSGLPSANGMQPPNLGDRANGAFGPFSAQGTAPPSFMPPQQQLAPQPTAPLPPPQQQPPPQPQNQVARHRTVYFGDQDVEQIPPSFKREGSDWHAYFNPKLPRSLDLNSLHSLEHPSVVCCVKFSMDGNYLATGCNRNAHIYDVAKGTKIMSLSDDTAKEGDLYIRSVCFSPDQRLLATGAEDKKIRIWDIQEQKVRMYFAGHEQDIYSLDFSRDGKTIVSGSGDRTVRVWDLETNQCKFVLGGDESGPTDAGVTSVAISPLGKYVAAGSLDRLVRLWDITTGKCVAKLESHKDSVYSVSFSPNGKSLVSGSLDRSLKLWDISGLDVEGSAFPSCKATFSGHKDFVLSVAFSPDGKFIISGSKDRSVQFWDPLTGQSFAVLQGHKNSVISVALNPQTRTLATGSGDCKARLWTFETK